MASTNQVILALYDDDDVLLKGVKELRQQGYAISEVYTPFPVHGLDHALGLKETRIGNAAFIYGLLGFITASSIMYGMMIVDWPMNIGGKPSFSFYENMPAFVPIMFELTVFFAAHLMVWTFFFRNGIYPGKNPDNPDPRTTDDKFMVEIALEEGQGSDELNAVLNSTGAMEVTTKTEGNDQ